MLDARNVVLMLSQQSTVLHIFQHSHCVFVIEHDTHGTINIIP
jgi:hypothetical protein